MNEKVFIKVLDEKDRQKYIRICMDIVNKLVDEEHLRVEEIVIILKVMSQTLNDLTKVQRVATRNKDGKIREW